VVLAIGGDWSRTSPDVVFFRQLSWAEVVVGRVSKAEVESKVFPVLLYYLELSLTHVHSLETAVA